MTHLHDLKKTHVCFVEFDDVVVSKLAIDKAYFGEGNSKGRKMEFDFEYCLNCGFRLLDGKPVKTQDILEQEFESLVVKAKNNNYLATEQTVVQHSDFEILESLIQSALKFGELKEPKADVAFSHKKMG